MPSAIRASLAISLIVAGFTSATGCGGDPDPVRYTAPTHARATLILDPPTLEIGDVATLEIAVSTPPGHHVRPFDIPTQIDGLWILESETLEVEREPHRWLHRRRVRIRPREVGRFVWPAGQIEVESARASPVGSPGESGRAPDRDIQILETDAIEIVVGSVIRQHQGRLTPYGLEALEFGRERDRPWLWAVGGGSFVLACLGLVALARRQRDRVSSSAGVSRPQTALWTIALNSLDEIAESLEHDPIVACEQISGSLRKYMDARFGATSVSRTTEELEVTAPPFAATSRWPGFVGLLRRLDDHRFPIAHR